MNTIVLRGCRADSLAGYLMPLGLLRTLSRQRDPSARLHWASDTAVLTTALDASELADWVTDAYAPSPILSPWNRGSGFAGTGKSATAETALAAFRVTAEPRFAALQEAIEAADWVVLRGRRRGWEGKNFWNEDRKADVVRLCRARLPDEALPWIDVAVTLTSGDLQFSPLTGTGGNFGRQDLSATFLQRLALVAGPGADRPRSRGWVEAALFGREDVPYVRETVGQYDPGRAGGILSTPREKSDDSGFANPWSLILTLEGTLLFASAVTRRFGSAFDNGALPFLTRASAIGYDSAAVGETVKGEQWVPLWPRPSALGEIEHLLGEGRAQWRDRQARTGLEFAMAVAALGVDRGLSSFRRFVIAERLGQNPLAIPVSRVQVRAEPRERLLHGPYDWIDRLKRLALPAGVASAVRRVEQEMYAVAAGAGGQALAGFVIEFGRVHAAVARSGTIRAKIRPYRPERPSDWRAQLPYDDELWIAAGFASLRDTRATKADVSLRGLLTRVQERRSPGGRSELVWVDRPASRLDLNGSTLTRALAEAHRRRVHAIASDHVRSREVSADQVGVQSGYPRGSWLPLSLVDEYARGWLDDELIADYLNGLLVLGCKASTKAPWPGGHQRPVTPLLAAMLPFYGPDPIHVTDKTNPRESPPSHKVRLVPRADWVPLLVAGNTSDAARDVRLRLALAGCHPVIPHAALADSIADGVRLAGALLLHVPPDKRASVLTAVGAVKASTATPLPSKGTTA